MPITIDGKTFTVPGVYGTVEVVNLGSVGLPAFNNLLLIGSARQGIPYNASDKKGYEVIKSFSSIGEAKKYYGNGELVKAAAYAKKGGAGVIHFINIASLTKALATVKDSTEVTPLATFDLIPQDKFFGVAGNDISVAIATATGVVTITIIPPKNHKFLSANAATSSRVIALEDLEGLAVGQTYKLIDNTASAAQEVTIVSMDAENNTITIDDDPDAAYATTGYARIFQEDSDRQESKAFTVASTNITDIINWINSGQIVKADRKDYTGGLPATLAKSYIGLIASATKGTSPVATETAGGDYDDFVADAARIVEEFTSYTKTRLRLFVPLSSNSDVHAVLKGMALDFRTNLQYSIKIITGCALGDIEEAESDSDHPISRAKVLNNHDVILCGMGIDGKDASLSSAPLLAGMISANSVKRNLTNDVVSATSVEKFFGEYNRLSETAKFVDNGVIVFGTGKNGFYIIQGVNTYQNHATIWNEQDKQSYLIQQGQIVDYVYEGYKEQMELGVGADGYGPEVARQQGIKILDKYLTGGFITERKILSAYREQNAVITNPQIKPIDATDFVGFVLSVVIDN